MQVQVYEYDAMLYPKGLRFARQVRCEVLAGDKGGDTSTGVSVS